MQTLSGIRYQKWYSGWWIFLSFFHYYDSTLNFFFSWLSLDKKLVVSEVGESWKVFVFPFKIGVCSTNKKNLKKKHLRRTFTKKKHLLHLSCTSIDGNMTRSETTAKDLLLNHTAFRTLLFLLINHHTAGWLWSCNSLIWNLWLIFWSVAISGWFLWWFCTILLIEKRRHLKIKTRNKTLGFQKSITKVWQFIASPESLPQVLSHRQRRLCHLLRGLHSSDFHFHLIATDLLSV